MSQYILPSGERYVFYNSYRTTLWEYLENLGIFFLYIALFSWLLYMIGSKFVGRALQPVRENLANMSEFIHNAWHELKTPLAVLRGNMQVMQAEQQFDEALVNNSVSRIDGMNRLMEGLIELSEVWTLSQKSELSLENVLQKSIDELAPLAWEKQITMNLDIENAQKITANLEEAKILLKNIVKNAIKYTPEGWTIDVHLSKNIVRIRDSGIGIAPQELSKIFERFYQWSDARSSEGYGIGLSLVKKIATVNNWSVTVESDGKNGTTFIVAF